MAAMSPTGIGQGRPGQPNGSISPRTVAEPKQVTFVLIFQASRGRLPLRVKIYPHDATESIVSTVKNFYGLYTTQTISKGVSFEDAEGNILIPHYENFVHDMTVSVRVHDELPRPYSYDHPPAPQHNFYTAETFMSQSPLPPPPRPDDHLFARPHSPPASRLRSPSPNGGRGRRSGSANNNPGSKKVRSRSVKNRSQLNGDSHGESFNGYSSGDGAPGSSSSKSKDHLGNTEISVDNIVEGGRRKRPKFDSSELPLYAPLQMPAATSNPSVSPARRADHQHRPSLPYIQSGPNPFSNPRPSLHSPHSYNNGFAHPSTYPTPSSDMRRSRGSFGFAATPGMPMVATPDGTANSCMSEEDKDVAIQLMRLGEISTHGRTSASTMDDTFSGRADATSSTGATSEADSDHDVPAARRQKLDAAGHHKKVLHTTESHFVGPADGADTSGEDGYCSDSAPKPAMAAPKPRTKLKANTLHQAKAAAAAAAAAAQSKPRPQKPKVKKEPAAVKTAAVNGGTAAALGPMSPASLPASRKQSVASNTGLSLAAGDDEHPDLSTKPRCQRCRKSKKGCDRQRPCGRCKDAGLGADQCISEDEGNGRKGRYGRHMGVPLVKEEVAAAPVAMTTLPPMMGGGFGGGVTGGAEYASEVGGGDKGKKRKR
ncbi:uncharacterized protein PODANS_2_3270 [Podospora anserina S mat+]|uniref:Podospora anserina S mat+ genomic DNA chromosome 2, supercontig 2 n=1 Tax=Podospora anserina (strain S / ATCC MYA-4624 / DSM 980 / FGSC 10383) TaxID=515849 RepID=B2B521_PODAN|nr:uncharacterized protein PODANS_2_3270 [Podospora anserina S mat+]CAP72896.1 unnamed protein product [Podospora anserina S mat+]CDP25296.1 Putative protein of unknown function [Podospora anserina S mat+]